MPNTDKNKSGGHSHPQPDSKNQSQQGDLGNSSSPDDKDAGRKSDVPKESFGSSGATDSH